MLSDEPPLIFHAPVAVATHSVVCYSDLYEKTSNRFSQARSSPEYVAYWNH